MRRYNTIRGRFVPANGPDRWKTRVVPWKLLCVVLGGALVVGVLTWLLLGAAMPDVADRASVSVALATLLLGAVTVWATLLAYQESARHRSYEAHVAIDVQIGEVIQAGGQRTLNPDLHIAANFKPDAQDRMPVMPDDHCSLCTLILWNSGRGPARNLRAARIAAGGRGALLEQKPQTILLGTQSASILAIDTVEAPNGQIDVVLEYENALGQLEDLNIQLNHQIVAERDGQRKDEWSIAKAQSATAGNRREVR